MTADAHSATKRRWLTTEVVQTSSMDCGPAALKCLLEGHGVSASYGRLREACQTDVDGTSIDTIEDIACTLGLRAEQCLIPTDHATMDEAALLPAIAVVAKTSDAATHFVVVWRRHGSWLQLMDPAVGRRWVKARQFDDELYKHSQSVDAEDWREWAETADFITPLTARLGRIGISGAAADDLVANALRDPQWLPLAALDASVRLVQSMVSAKGIRTGGEALAVVRALFRDSRTNVGDVHSVIPAAYWSVIIDPASLGAERLQLTARGAVLLTVKGMRPASENFEDEPELSMELAAALSEAPVSPLRNLWQLLVADGLLTPGALVVAMAVAAGALMLEALLFRGLFDIAAQLSLPSQRLFAGVGLIIFVSLLLGIDVAIGLQTLRMGRKLETRLRMALLEKLPRLNDRYFQSRPITDMADRNHNIHMTRGVPSTGLQLVQSVFELGLTLAGVLLIAPESLVLALALVAAAIIIPLITQQLLNERDLRVRNHAGALHSFYLDALLGLTPVRAHRAERNVQARHEGLLVEWALSLRGLIRMSLLTDGFQALVCTLLAGSLLIGHFKFVGGVSGSDLLLIFWTLKLPAVGARLAGIAHQYPAQRNVLLRLMEPLTAPDEIVRPTLSDAHVRTTELIDTTRPVGFRLENASVLAGGHEILRDVSLRVEPGEHIAIVGLSGAGKSSMLGLLLGWHRLSAGHLFVDGETLDPTRIEALRQATAWVDPAIQIWNRSLLDNLIYASENEAIDRIGDVIDAAKLRAVAQKLPQGLQSLLGEGGGMLSGGEGQRVRLGRALLSTGTRLVLLDEPFRGMDRTQRQALLIEARDWWADTTLLCVTHDVTETRAFPRVLVVEDGRVIEDGVPTELAAQSSRYNDLLRAEAAVGQQIWRGDYWRRVEMVGGQLEEPGGTR